MRSSGRGAEHVDLDHLDWVEDAPRRARSGAERRAAERRSAAGNAPARERRSTDRRSSERRAPAGGETERRARNPKGSRADARRPRARPDRRRPSSGPASPSVARSCSSPSCSSSTASSWRTAPRPPRRTSSTAAVSTCSAARWYGCASAWQPCTCSPAWTTPGFARPPSRSRGSPSPASSSSWCLVSAASSTAPAAGSTSAVRACSRVSSPSSPPWCSWRRSSSNGRARS